LDPDRLSELMLVVSGKGQQAVAGSGRLWDRKCSLPNVKGRRVLVAGVGGGCDIISAYAVAQTLKGQKPALLIYANTKRGVDNTLEQIAPNVSRVPKQVVELTSELAQEYGKTWIDQSVPRGDDGCPLIFSLPANESDVMAFIRGLKTRYGFDLIISVDTGADSIVSGALSGVEGRDQAMLRILARFGREWLHLAVAPGCDGETTCPDVLEALLRLEEDGKFVGTFSANELVPVYAQWAHCLQAERTPRIISDAAIGKLARQGEFVLVPRGMEPTIPAEWLSKVLVFRLAGK
jgi:hypothetical protein